MLHNKFWQGFFAIAPIVMFILFFIAYFFFIFSMIENVAQTEEMSGKFPSEILTHMGIFLVFILLMIFTSLGSLIFYIVHAVQNPNLKQGNMLLVWILLFVFVGGIGKLIYWIIEILGRQKEAIQETTNS